jgi:hypothetical protein
MVLADDPFKRHMCPVTLFFALAIADGVIENVSHIHDLNTVATQDWPGWAVLQYKDGMRDLPVLRRTSYVSTTMTQHAMKPKALDKMTRNQFIRAGHETTLGIILEDNRRAANSFRRERKSKRSIVPFTFRFF